MSLSQENEKEFLKDLNRITNEAVKYVDDYHHYHKDFWGTPYITLTEGGDCEDIALLKAVGLHLHGWKVPERGHILVGMINFHRKQTPHAVLQIKNKDGHSSVLRSINHDVLTFDQMEKIMKPLYMVSSKNIVIFKEKSKRFAYNIHEIDSVQTAAGEENILHQWLSNIINRIKSFLF